MKNRLITHNKQLVGLDGAAVSSEKPSIAVEFVKQTRIIIDKISRRGAPVTMTQVNCDGKNIAWILDVPKPPKLQSSAIVDPPDVVVWGFYGQTGEITMGAMLREKAERQAAEFARAVVLNEIEDNQAG